MSENAVEVPGNESETAETADTKKAKAEPRVCECSLFSVHNVDENGDTVNGEEHSTGCDGKETRNTFRPGHDAKLKSFLIRMGTLGHLVARDGGGVLVHDSAQSWADSFGFGHQVSSGIKKAQESEALKATKAAQRESDRTAKVAEKQAAKDARAAAKAAKLAEDREKAEYAARQAESQDGLMAQAETDVEADES